LAANAASTSTGPSSCSTPRCSGSMATKSMTSAETPIARPLSEPIASTTASILASISDLNCHRYAVSGQQGQVAAPMPPEPPVTTATLFARSG
jgi:hypothetical protein